VRQAQLAVAYAIVPSNRSPLTLLFALATSSCSVIAGIQDIQFAPDDVAAPFWDAGHDGYPPGAEGSANASGGDDATGGSDFDDATFANHVGSSGSGSGSSGHDGGTGSSSGSGSSGSGGSASGSSRSGGSNASGSSGTSASGGSSGGSAGAASGGSSGSSAGSTRDAGSASGSSGSSSGGPVCSPAYSQGNCLTYFTGIQVSTGGHNWICSTNNCRNCAVYSECGPGGTGCFWGTVWTDAGPCL
jgi:hypothetical protein